MNKMLTVLAISVIISLFALKGFSQQGGMFPKSRDLDFLKSQEKTKLVIFSASWCLPCKIAKSWLQEKDFKSLLSKYNVEYYDFDVDKSMRKKYNVSAVPTFIVIKNEEEQDRKKGISNGKNGLKIFLEAYKGA